MPLPSFVHVLSAVTDGTVDYGFVAMENSIEGTVSIALDQLVFERDLIIVGEVVLPVTQNLLAPPGTTVVDIKRVVSFPHATGQCRAWLTANLPDVEEVAATLDGRSGAPGRPRSGDRRHGRHRDGAGGRAVRPGGAGRPASRITTATPPASCWSPPTTPASRRRPGTTRRAWCASSRRPPGQPARDPRAVLGPGPQPGEAGVPADQAGARASTASSSTSRATSPTRWWPTACGTCTPVCRRLKFLGSYPAAGAHGPARRRDAERAWQAADRWIEELGPYPTTPDVSRPAAVRPRSDELGVPPAPAWSARASAAPEGWQSGRMRGS